MPAVWVSIGSNIDPTHHIREAIQALEARFGHLLASRVYETVAVGFEGDAFLNMVVGFATRESPEAVVTALRAIEDAAGRERSGAKFGSRTLDLDLLLYGDRTAEVAGKPLPHPDILKYPFVLGPLAELVPEGRHPTMGETYRELWQRMRARDGVALRPASLGLR